MTDLPDAARGPDDGSALPPPLPAWQAPTPAPSSDPAADPELRAMALRHLEAVKEFRIHLTVYVAVIGFLVVVWVLSGAGYFWPVWPAAAWGLGLGLHGASLLWDKDPTEEQIAAEEHRTLTEELNLQRAEERIGERLEVLIEATESDESDDEDDPEAAVRYVGRAGQQGPDVDGMTYVEAPDGRELRVGDMVEVEVVATEGIDLVGELR